MSRRVMLWAVFQTAFLCWTAGSSAQETRLPTETEVKEFQARYQTERRDILKKGIEKHFVPYLMKRAEILAQHADRALEGGRLFQASESYRQARWLLPYQSRRVPAEHIAMILGSMRLRHEEHVTAVAFSPDGRLLVSGGKDHAVRVWDLENGHEIVTYTGHANYVSAVVFSPDGKSVVSAGAEKDIRVWDPLTGKDLRTFPGTGAFVYSLVFTADGKYLVSGQGMTEAKKENVLCIYETGSGKLHRTINDLGDYQPRWLSFGGGLLAVGSSKPSTENRACRGEVRLYDYPRMLTQPFFFSQQFDRVANQPDQPCLVALNPDGRFLAQGDRDGIRSFEIVPVKDAVPYKVVYRGHIAMPCASVIFSRDGQSICGGSSDGSVRIFDNNKLVQTGVQKGHTGEVQALAFNQTGAVLASAGADHTVRLWQGEVVIKSRDFLGHEGPVWKSSFSADGLRIVSASADRTVRIWDVASDKVLHVLTGHTAPVTSALFSPDGKFVASAGGDRTVKIWDAQTGKHLHDLAGHTHTVTCLDFSSDGKKLVSGAVDRQIKVWDWQAGKELLALGEIKSIPAAVAVSPDGKQIAAGFVDATIRLFEAESGKLQKVWTAHGNAVTGLAYSPDGTRLASSGADQLAKVWNLAVQGMAPILLNGHTGPVSSVAFRKDGRHVATCGSDTLVKLWKLEADSGKDVQTFRGHKDWVTSVSFSRDGFYIVSSGVDRIVKINEITTRDSPLAGEPGGNLVAVASSPDGKYIAVGGTDRIIRVWDRATGSETAALIGHTKEISALAFSADSKRLVSGGDDKTLKLWDLATGTESPRLEAQMQNWANHPEAPLLLSVADSPVGMKLFILEPQKRPEKANINPNRSKIIAYELATGKFLFEVLDDRDNRLGSISGDGRTAAIAARDGTVRLFDLEKKGQLFPGGDWFLYDKEGISDMALSGDGAYLASGNDTGELRISKVANKEVLHKINAHNGKAILVCLISPDGKRVATAGADNVVKVWDLASGKELRRWSTQVPGVTSSRALVSNLCFTSDSKQLITSNNNATLFVLDLP